MTSSNPPERLCHMGTSTPHLTPEQLENGRNAYMDEAGIITWLLMWAVLPRRIARLRRVLRRSNV
jgi:hypothetical protein